ncbi:MAG: metallophosphoesterase [Planctomycetota bacterium]
MNGRYGFIVNKHAILWIAIVLSVFAAGSNGQQSDFSIIVLPDTQNYSCECGGGDAQTFYDMTDWIVDNTSTLNVKYVAHMGDVVQSGDDDITEWQNAEDAMELLEDPVTTGLPEGIPFGLAVGNHDQTPHRDPDGTTTYFNQFFGESRFSIRSYYGDNYGSNNDNHYDLFSGASGLHFIIIYMEYDKNPPSAVLDWADNLLSTYSDRRGIVVVHNLLTSAGDFSNQGQDTYDALKGNDNLFLMLGGHHSAEVQRSDTYSGNTVYSFITDYQDRDNGGDGWLRILEFSPADDEINVKTYSPTLDQYETDSNSQFTLDYDMSVSFNEVTIDMDLIDFEDGLTRPSPEPTGGITTDKSKGGRDCRRNKTPNTTNKFFYFCIDDGWAYGGNKSDVYITIDYYVDNTDSYIQCHYDAGASNVYKSAGRLYPSTSGSWQTKTWHVTDADFSNRQAGSADFRIKRSGGNYIWMDTVEVDDDAP